MTNKLKICEEPLYTKCEICNRETNEGALCGRCFYGMRLDTERWIAELKAEGIEVERTGGCMPIKGGFICSNPYSRKDSE